MTRETGDVVVDGPRFLGIRLLTPTGHRLSGFNIIFLCKPYRRLAIMFSIHALLSVFNWVLARCGQTDSAPCPGVRPEIKEEYVQSLTRSLSWL